MHSFLLVFEFLGTTELLVIAVVALILFGPRRLPEIGRKVGKGIAEFKRASDDFKRTWEYEVELEHRKPALDAAEGAAASVPPGPVAETAAGGVGAEDLFADASQQSPVAPTVARGSSDAEDVGVVAGAEPPAGDSWGATGGVADGAAARAAEDEGKTS
ncbi:MAG TPA: twin-arginine translocase TatA/TatE family subunit [Pyrinomonadaceae bacterium]|jgi:TatA/E family protein of Tat protein translocase